MSIRERAASIAVRIFCRVFGLDRPSRWSARVARMANETAACIADKGLRLRFLASSPLLLWRAATLHSKEPETLRWLDTLNEDDVLFDVGANVGMYSIYGGMRCRRVCAFEPESANFAVLNRNIGLNGLTDRIIAYPLALSDEERLDTLRLSSVEPGAALHAFGTNVDFRGKPFEPRFSQGSICTTLDALIDRWGLECPTHLKIDVDGLEPRIVRGAQHLLANARLRSILIEINEMLALDRDIVQALERHGFTIAATGEPIEDEAGTMRMRNYVFER